MGVRFDKVLFAARGIYQQFPEDREVHVHTRSFKLLTVFLGWILLLPAAARGQEKTVLVEPGSSMPEPLYKNWIDEFHKRQPATDIHYLAPGPAETARKVRA